MSGTSARRARRAEGQRLLDSLARDHFERPDVSRAPMFESLGLRGDGTLFAFVGAEGHLVLRLPPEQAASLVANGEAAQVRIGRNPARAWVSVPMPTAEDGPARWRALLRDAYGDARSPAAPSDGTERREAAG